MLTAPLPECVVLCGGIGSRVASITNGSPKCLLRFRGVPFIYAQICWLAMMGVRTVILSTGKSGSEIFAALEDFDLTFIEVRYVEDGDSLLGTGGALIKCLPYVNSPYLLCTYGDSLLKSGFLPLASSIFRNGGVAGVAVLKNEDRGDISNIKICGQSVTAYKKGAGMRNGFAFIDYGVSCFQVDYLSRNFRECSKFDLSKIFEICVASNSLTAVEVSQPFREIGTPNSYDRAVLEFDGDCCDRLREIGLFERPLQ